MRPSVMTLATLIPSVELFVGCRICHKGWQSERCLLKLVVLVACMHHRSTARSEKPLPLHTSVDAPARANHS